MATRIFLGSGAALAVVILTGAVISTSYASPADTKSDRSAQTQMERGAAMQLPARDVNNPRKALHNADIEDKDGNSVGSVDRVVTNRDGIAIAVHADVGGFLGIGSKKVSLPARDLTYERDRNVLITHMTKREIKALPSI